ncbi:MAG TPA: type II toxin-antitoxin system VapC family toxin [Phycisphaerae bacterium]|nr:type II toxin-antitoxin system VapC family toxin [Phycisphaerae bacterium]
MPLDVPDGTPCFVDSNIFYYALVPTPPLSDPCINLLNRALSARLSLSVSISVLSDTLHKVMTSEVAQLAKRDRAGIIGYLGKHPEIIGKLVEYPLAIDRLKTLPLTILPVDDQLLRDAVSIAVTHHLLTNDALIIALMQRHQLTHLITNDDDFDRVPGLTIWKPRQPS